MIIIVILILLIGQLYNFKKRLPAIVVSVKRSKKKIRQKNNKNGNIIKIQSAWRGYFLRKIAIGSIKKYIGFIALIKYIQKIYDKNNKKLLMIKLKEYNNKSINPKMYPVLSKSLVYSVSIACEYCCKSFL